MARFKYLGEPARPSFVLEQGPTLRLVLHNKDGSDTVVNSPEGGFVIGDDIGVDVDDERALRHLRADTRFEEL